MERDQSKIKKIFHDVLQDAKDALNTRFNEKTGTYYVKGRGGMTLEKENPISGLSEYGSDPNR